MLLKDRSPSGCMRSTGSVQSSTPVASLHTLAQESSTAVTAPSQGRTKKVPYLKEKKET